MKYIMIILMLGLTACSTSKANNIPVYDKVNSKALEFIMLVDYMRNSNEKSFDKIRFIEQAKQADMLFTCLEVNKCYLKYKTKYVRIDKEKIEIFSGLNKNMFNSYKYYTNISDAVNEIYYN